MAEALRQHSSLLDRPSFAHRPGAFTPIFPVILVARKPDLLYLINYRIFPCKCESVSYHTHSSKCPQAFTSTLPVVLVARKPDLLYLINYRTFACKPVRATLTVLSVRILMDATLCSRQPYNDEIG